MRSYGFEQEIPFLRDKGRKMADHTNTTFEELQSIIDEMPYYEKDYPKIRIGNLGIKEKRWYVKGFERYLPDGSYISTLPKGFEIRTLPHPSIQECLDEFSESYRLLIIKLQKAGFQPICISHHPYLTEFVVDPPFNSYELLKRLESPESITAAITQLTFSPDLNISFPEFSDDQLIDSVQKLTYYSPFIIPFTFSSPFVAGKLWEGYSARTYVRAGLRPAAMAYLHNEKNVVQGNPSITKPSRSNYEKGRIEFRSFDACNDMKLYASLFSLIEGIILDNKLRGRSFSPDKEFYQISALKGFDDPQIKEAAQEVINVAAEALGNRAGELSYLQHLLDNPSELPVWQLINSFQKTKSLEKTLLQFENAYV